MLQRLTRALSRAARRDVSWLALLLLALFAIEGLLIHSTVGATAFLLDGRRERGAASFRDPATFRLDGPDSVR